MAKARPQQGRSPAPPPRASLPPVRPPSRSPSAAPAPPQRSCSPTLTRTDSPDSDGDHTHINTVPGESSSPADVSDLEIDVKPEPVVPKPEPVDPSLGSLGTMPEPASALLGAITEVLHQVCVKLRDHNADGCAQLSTRVLDQKGELAKLLATLQDRWHSHGSGRGWAVPGLSSSSSASALLVLLLCGMIDSFVCRRPVVQEKYPGTETAALVETLREMDKAVTRLTRMQVVAEIKEGARSCHQYLQMGSCWERSTKVLQPDDRQIQTGVTDKKKGRLSIRCVCTLECFTQWAWSWDPEKGKIEVPEDFFASTVNDPKFHVYMLKYSWGRPCFPRYRPPQHRCRIQVNMIEVAGNFLDCSDRWVMRHPARHWQEAFIPNLLDVLKWEKHLQAQDATARATAEKLPRETFCQFVKGAASFPVVVWLKPDVSAADAPRHAEPQQAPLARPAPRQAPRARPSQQHLDTRHRAPAPGAQYQHISRSPWAEWQSWSWQLPPAPPRPPAPHQGRWPVTGWAPWR